MVQGPADYSQLGGPGKRSLICEPYDSVDMRQNRSPGLRLSRAANAVLILLLGLLGPAWQAAPKLLPAEPLSQSPVASPLSPAEPEQSTPGAAADTDEATSFAPGFAPTLEIAPTQPAAPTIRTELAATNPATVNLASGKPTLVEFFAFW